MHKRRKTRSSFSDLPHELLSNISDRLGLIDLLSFRGVCKNTRSASSHSSAAIEEQSFSQCNPWFLLYGNGPNCSIVNNTFYNKRRYKINLPEIADYTCVASLAGWLLFLSHDSSMFFFCPFSKSRIDLPNCPFASTDLNFTVAFSHSPTNRDCAIVVLGREDHFYKNMEIWLLRRSDSEWCKYEHDRRCTEFGAVKNVMYHEGTFHILDSYKGVVIFNVEMKTWSMNICVPVTIENYGEDKYKVSYEIKKNRFSLKSKEMKSILGIQDKACTITICGTLLILKKDRKYRLIEHEKYNDDERRSRTHRQLKGVWIQPRFHQIPLNQSWSL